MSKVKFYRDAEGNVPTGLAHAGKMYFTDQGNLYVIDSAGNKQKFSDVIFAANYAAIAAISTKLQRKIYVAIMEKTMWFWDGTTLQPLGGSGGGGGTGDVVGPASAITLRIATFDGTSGKIIRDGGRTIAEILDRGQHTGTQDAATISGSKTASFISDFAATVRATVITGLVTTTHAVIAATDTLLVALGKLQRQITEVKIIADAALPNSAVIDEDDMASDSDAHVPTQQSVKAYVDATVTATGAGDMSQATYDPAGIGEQLVGETAAQTLTNKTLTAPVINSPTGLVKADVGLGNVDNTSDATKNSATATLTNKTLTAPVINNPTGIVKADVGLGNVDNTSDATKNAATATLTNKRITNRVQSTASAGTVTPNADADDCVTITAQAAALTLANPTGTPTSMQPITLRIKDNGTARTIGYGSQYRAIGITLPTTTVVGKTIYLGMMYNAADTKWDVIGYALEA
jgi:hypothetical protein